MKKIVNKFSLIELVVVLIIISLLAAIVVPNVSSFRKDANETAINSTIRNMQAGVDMYSLDNHSFMPVAEQPTATQPQPIDLSLMHPDFIRNLPKIDGVYYWVDYQGKVWSSYVDSPTNVTNNNGSVSWDEIGDATEYKVYEVQSGTTSAVTSERKMKFITVVPTNAYAGDAAKEYAVSAIDPNGFESAPAGRGYVALDNRAPVARITLNPAQGPYYPNTEFSFSHTDSVDPDGNEIVAFEWDNKRTNYLAGSHKVKLRVKDSKGAWSEWTELQITIGSNGPPVAVITKTPGTGPYYNNTAFSFTHTASTDPDGDSIVAFEWENKQSSYLAGNHIVKLRVKDSKGAWSEWVETTFTVEANRPPVAVISSTPGTGPYYTNTVFTFSHTSSTDPDGDSIAEFEWQNKQSSYASGTHKVQLRVKDSKGAWSGWTELTLTIADNRAPVAQITTTPASGPYYSTTNFTFSHTASTDPDGDSIAGFEWQNKQTNYAVGNHTVQLRVKDSKGLWSAWVSKTITIQQTVATSCLNHKNINPSAASGEYTISPRGYSGSIQVYCDMITDGGGWTKIVATTGSTHDFGQNSGTPNLTYTSDVRATVGLFNAYRYMKFDNSQVMLTNSANQFASFNLVEGVSNYTVHDLMVHASNEQQRHADDTAYDGARVVGGTSMYSGTKRAGTISGANYFFMTGINESSDNDISWLAFADSTGSSNNWGDSWRGNSQVGTVWSFANHDFHTASERRMYKSTNLQGLAGSKVLGSGAYSVWIR